MNSSFELVIIPFDNVDNDFDVKNLLAVKIIDESVLDYGIAPGNIALFHRVPNVQRGEVAFIQIITLEGSSNVIREYFYSEEPEIGHWFLKAGGPNEKHLVIIPKGTSIEAIKAVYANGEPGKILFYENAEVAILGKLAGIIKGYFKYGDQPISELILKDLLPQELTPYYFSTTINPFLIAVDEIQQIINEIRGDTHRVKIHSITQTSPVTATVEGIATAIHILDELVFPWKRKHAQEMAKLAEQEKRADIKQKTAELAEARARIEKTEAEKAKLLAETARQHHEAEQMALQTQMTKLQLQKAKMQLALEFVEMIKPNLSEEERLTHVVQILPQLETVLSSPLDVFIVRNITSQ